MTKADAITERDLRAVVRHRGWAEQRGVFHRLVNALTSNRKLSERLVPRNA